MLFYRLLLTVVMPALLARLIWRGLRGRESWSDLGERLGSVPRSAAPTLWLHGASNGELTSARALAADLLAARPDLHLRITANTVTARAMARGWDLPRTDVRLAPLDLRCVLGRFLSRTQPVALAVVENEFWPNRLTLMQARGLPVIAVGARMSARTARGWARFPALSARLMGAIALLSPQDRGSADRFTALGLAPPKIGPVLNLKAAVTPPVNAEELARLIPALPRARCWLAASTHEGEDGIILDAFAALHAEDPSWRLILAPRHPRRAEALAQMIAARGFGLRRRSAGDPAPDPAHPVLLADTMGEMGLWYALAGISFIGGSLIDKGGHTPFEPAALGSAILTGPHVANAAEAYAALTAAGGATVVQNAEELAQALRDRADPTAQQAQAAAARTALAPATGAQARAALVAAILALLPPAGQTRG